MELPSADSSAPPLRQRSYDQTPVSSKAIPGLFLQRPDGQYIHKYGYYVQLRTNASWRVPLIFGTMPTTPDDASTNMEKGMYALRVMILFRHHRLPTDLIRIYWVHRLNT